MRGLVEKNEWLLVWFLLTTLFIGLTIILIWLGGSINGPFIFADEAEYHWLASELYHFKKFHATQYNPLYPLLIAPTFYLNDLATQFFAIKIINQVVFLSIIFPAYLIARDLLVSKSYAILLAVVVALAPIGSYSHMVWADPLYYTLICWGYYFLIRYLMRENIKDIFYTGVFIGLGFLAKQAALFFLISIYVYVAYAAVSGTKKFDWKAFVSLTIGVAMIALPWLIKNVFLGESVVGYSGTFSLFFEALKNDPQHLVGEFFLGIGYSVTYLFFIYFGAGFFLLLFAAFKKDRRNENDNVVVSTLAKIVLLHTFLLMVVSELLFVPYGNHSSAIGRYIDVIYPVAIIVITWVLMRQARFNQVFIISTAVICFFLLLLFSPLTQVKAFAVTTNSGVSILSFFWSEFLWDSPSLSPYNKITLSTAMTALLVSILMLRKNAIWIICLFSLLLGLGAHLFAISVGETTVQSNQVFLELEKAHFTIDEIAIDSALDNGSTSYRIKFWHPTDFNASKFIDPISLLKKISIDFGLQGNKAGNGVMKIWAPWNPESGYSEIFGLGFNDTTTLNASKCPDITGQGDFIFDHKPLEFKLHLPVGSYILKGKSADTKCLGVESNFTAQVQNGDSAEIHHDAEFILPFDIINREQGLKLSLKPADGFVWALDDVTIVSQGKSLSQATASNPRYILSKKLLPFPQVFSIFDYRLYKSRDVF
jgi:hypothetical protein